MYERAADDRYSTHLLCPDGLECDRLIRKRAVPDRRRLGVTLNDDVVRQHLAPRTGYFEPTPEWDEERSWDRLWS